MAKSKRKGICVYCRRWTQVTDDHVPARNLFDKPEPADLIKVPACIDCNCVNWSREDEYFRLMLGIRDDVADQPAVQRTMMPAIRRSLQKPEAPGLRRGLLSATEHQRVMTPTGIDTGVRPIYKVDLLRVSRVAARVIVGLHYHETHRFLSKGWGATAYHQDALALDGLLSWKDLARRLQGTAVKSVGGGIFEYRYRLASDEPRSSLWGVRFFQRVEFLGATIPEGELSPASRRYFV